MWFGVVLSGFVVILTWFFEWFDVVLTGFDWFSVVFGDSGWV